MGLREFLPRHPQAICATCSSSPAVVSKEGPPGLASTLPATPPHPPKGGYAHQVLVGMGEEQVPLLTGGKGLEKYSQESSRSLLYTLVTLPSVFLPSLFPFPHHLGHLTGHPVSHDMMYPGCVLSRVLLRVRGSSEHRWVEAKGRKKGAGACMEPGEVADDDI